MRTIVAAALAIPAFLPPAQALDMPPDVLFKGQYARVSVFLGDRLRQNKALAQNCKQEGRDWAQALEAGEKAKSSEPPKHVPSFGRRYDISAIVGNQRYLSIVRMSGADIDGVYSVINDTFLWDSRLKKRIGLAAFFNETKTGGPAMTRLFVEATSGLIQQAGKENATAVIGTLRPSLDNMGPISLAPSTASGKSSGLNFHYSVPKPGRFDLNDVAIFVPWTKFKSHLSLFGLTIFGGNWRERYIW